MPKVKQEFYFISDNILGLLKYCCWCKNINITPSVKKNKTDPVIYNETKLTFMLYPIFQQEQMWKKNSHDSILVFCKKSIWMCIASNE